MSFHLQNSKAQHLLPSAVETGCPGPHIRPLSTCQCELRGQEPRLLWPQITLPYGIEPVRWACTTALHKDTSVQGKRQQQRALTVDWHYKRLHGQSVP